jgi:hypothetical protein
VGRVEKALKRAMGSDIVGRARSYWPCHPDLTVALKLHFVLDVVVHRYNPCTWEAEAGGSWI